MTKKEKPFSVRLGELREPLQKEATERDRSLHWLILAVLEVYIKENKKKATK